MAIVGYARVSRPEQDPELQLRALREAGCEQIWTEHASGAERGRPELLSVLSYLRAGDCLVVWKLDRLGRSLSHLIEVIGSLGARGVEFRSLSEGMDTTTANGRLLFHVFGAVAEFERELIRERTLAGLAAARASGHHGGRRPVMTPYHIRAAREMVDQGRSMKEIARTLGVGRTTLYRAREAGWAGAAQEEPS